jgi:PAS domain S-box-containing protein
LRSTIPPHEHDRPTATRRAATGRKTPSEPIDERLRRAERQAAETLALLDTLQSTAPVGFGFVDREFRIVRMNETLAAVNGAPLEQQLGRTVAEVVPEVWSQVEAVYRRALVGEAVTNIAITARTAADPGAAHHWLGSYYPVRLADEVIGVGIVVVDVTERTRFEAERSLLAAAIEQSAESVMITDGDAGITYVNNAFERISGYPSREVIGRNPRFLKSGAQSSTFFDAMWAAIANGLPWVADMTNRRKDGSLYHLTSVISPIRAEDQSITGYVAVGRDVSQERELETRTELLTRERALIADTLRRLPSGGTLEETAQLFCRQVRSLTDVAVTSLIIFESDGSAIPVAYVAPDGREAGLRRLTGGRSRYLRDRAAAGPWVEAWRGHRAHPYAESLRRAGVKAVAHAPVAFEGSVIGVLSVGSAESDAMTQLSGQLGAIVDFANLAGALLGRRVGDGREGRRLRTVVEGIIAEGAFTPVFQPIVDIIRGRTLGYEALTRFSDDLAPDVRFADAAVVGMGIDLERATLEAALTAARALSPSRFIHLNVSPALVLAGTDLRRLLAGTRARIVLEITEHAAVGDYAAFRAAIDGLGRPVLLAVDDAGAGFASFRHILELRPAFVKLDASLVRGIDADPAKQALVAGMHHFARMTSRRLIAEGIETEAEAEALRRLDVRLGQGYLFGRPAPLIA